MPAVIGRSIERLREAPTQKGFASMTAPQPNSPQAAFDVVVIGGGGSGLAAAVTAATAGVRVILLEKNAALGGSTALSVGSFSAAGTSVQRAADVADTPETFRSDLALSNGTFEEREDEVLRDVLVANSGVAFDWLRSLGLEFIGPTEEPPFTKPRMHNIIPNSRAYIVELERAARRAGVTIRTGFRVERLVQDSAARVIGVDGPERIDARYGVILATGDYSASAELKARWMGPQSAALPPVNPTSTGDGFVMAMALGAVPKNTDRAVEDLRLPPPKNATIGFVGRLPTSPRVARVLRIAIERLPRRIVTRFVRAVLTGHVAPSTVLFQAGAILVNTEGSRFTNEQESPARALATQRENACYIVFDARVARQFSAWPHPLSTFPGVAYAYLGDYERFRPDAVHRAPSIDELAANIGVDGGELRRTVARYNDAVAAGDDEDFHRPSVEHPIVEGPFYAIGPLRGFVTITDGGLSVDARCRVLDGDGGPIAGLYAVGSTGQGGLILRNHGLHIAWAITSGRVAAAAALGDGLQTTGRQ